MASIVANKRYSTAKRTPSPFVYVEERQVSVYDFTKQAWDPVPLSSPVEIGLDCRYVWVEAGLFCSGGGKDCKRTYLLDRDWGITYLCDMLASRNNHGLWASARSVLTFGGTIHTGYCKANIQMIVRQLSSTVKK